ncbi:hydrogenase nickel incorporation protein HypA [Rhodococcus erythropolis CCM2595]|nr:hydrogenase nickel incorporation protein HypA [Rhodococcus erythropolis CCM2595]
MYGLRTAAVGAYRGREVSGSRIVGFTVHELSIAQSVVEAVCERAGDRRVASVRLEVGQLCAVVPHSLLFCFDVVTAGTHAEGASLHIDEIATSARCKSCGVTFSPPDMFLLCGCGSADVEVLAGRELRILSMEVS